MFKFAKVFNCGNRQVLFTKSANIDGVPQLLITFHVHGLELSSTAVVMNDKSQSSWDELNHLFNEVDHAIAMQVCQQIDHCIKDADHDQG